MDSGSPELVAGYRQVTVMGQDYRNEKTGWAEGHG